jgi:hypothetical protein
MNPLYLLPLFIPLAMNGRLHSLALNYELYHPSAVDSWLREGGFKPHEGLDLGMNLDLARGVYWDNTIKAVTDTGQYRSVAWEFRLYVKPFANLEVGYHHESRHLLDAQAPDHFPVADRLQVNWTIYSSPEPRRGWF